MCLSPLTGLQLTETPGTWWRGGLQDAAVRVPHESAQKELLQIVDVQIPHPIQEDRCHLQNHFPSGLRYLQFSLLVSEILFVNQPELNLK